jgi:hypothetical protein
MQVPIFLSLPVFSAKQSLLRKAFCESLFSQMLTFIPRPILVLSGFLCFAEAESKENHGVWDPMLDLISTPELTPTHLPWATLCQSRP